MNFIVSSTARLRFLQDEKGTLNPETLAREYNLEVNWFLHFLFSGNKMTLFGFSLRLY